MAQPQFNIGRDATLNFVVNGVALKPTLLTNFTFKQEVEKVVSKPLNRRPLRRNLPMGWSGTAEYDRADSVIDDYFAAAEDGFWNTGAAVDDVFILQTIKDANTGVVSQYRFENVTLEYADGGSFKMDAAVQVKINFEAAGRRKVA